MKAFKNIRFYKERIFFLLTTQRILSILRSIKLIINNLNYKFYEQCSCYYCADISN